MKTINLLKKLVVPVSAKMFLLVFLCIIIPLNVVTLYMKGRYEDYLETEMSNKIVQTISKGQEILDDTLQKMANLSNIIVYHEDVRDAFSDLKSDYVDNRRIVDGVLTELISLNLFDMNDISIALLDGNGKLYGNWNVYSHYNIVTTQDWVRESIWYKGHIVWNMFSAPYNLAGRNDTQHISMARSILDEGVTGSFLGTVIITISRERLSDILTQYAYDESDCVYLCAEDTLVLSHDPAQAIDAETLNRLWRETDGNHSGGTVVRLENRRYLVSYYSISNAWYTGGNELRVFHFTDYQQVDGQLARISGILNIVLVFLFILTLFMAVMIVKWLCNPLKELADTMDSFHITQESVALDTARRDEIGRLNASYQTMSGNIRELFAELNREYAVREKYRFESLRAQVNPHFLFNTLNSIRWMSIIRKTDNITQSIDALANMLRYSMSRGSEFATLREELANVQDYVFIQNMRYGDRFRITSSIGEEILSCRVIRFILQPIVENALIHGFRDTGGEGEIHISAEGKGDTLMLYVHDNGVGMPRETLDKLLSGGLPDGRERHVTGIGIENVNDRIRVSYGDAYGLRFESGPKGGTTVIYTLPVLFEEGGSDEKADDRG